MSPSNADDIADRFNIKLRLENKRSTETSINQATCHCAGCQQNAVFLQKLSSTDENAKKNNLKCLMPLQECYFEN